VNPSQSVYLLGTQETSILVLLQRLQRECVHLGECLTIEEHLDCLACYERDSQSLHGRLPVCVFRPFNTQAIAPFVKSCQEYRFSITTRCGGTGLTGGVVANQGSILLLTGHLKAIVSHNLEKGEAIVEPGITVHQLNQVFRETSWVFPLEMLSAGVAGLGGMLNTRAKGYHQDRDISAYIRSVTIVDGSGIQIEVPAPLVEGSEGLFGITTQLTLQLAPKPAKRVVLQLVTSWEQIKLKEKKWKDQAALTALMWDGKTTFTWILEGETWRVHSAHQHLLTLFGTMEELSTNWIPDLYPVGRSVVALSHAFPSKHVFQAVFEVCEICQDLEFHCHLCLHVREGSLHLALSSKQTGLLFSKTLERWMVRWIERLIELNGFLISLHGVGSLFQPYLPPFYCEEEWDGLKQWVLNFDPNQVFGRDRFFPIKGKSLEKRWQ
jgi:FAD/FMN-containing dehydrogenase